MEKIDAKLIETIDAKVKEFNQQIKEYTTDEKIEAIVKNLANSNIKQIVVELTQDLRIKKIQKYIDEVFYAFICEEDIKQTIRQDIKEYLYSDRFHDNIKTRLEVMIDKSLGYSEYD